MKTVVPAIAAVRPRANRRGSAEHRLLEEMVAEFADETPECILRLAGPCGSGKSTALAHLAAVFADDRRFVFLDEPDLAKIEQPPDRIVVVATRTIGSLQSNDLRLDPWRLDELVEYLLAKHHDACGSIITRLDKQARRAWLPEIAVLMLELFAANPQAADVGSELSRFVHARLNVARVHEAIGRYCVSTLTAISHGKDAVADTLPPVECPGALRRYFRHAIVQTAIGAEHIQETLRAGSFYDLQLALPSALVKRVGQRCRDDKLALQTLQKATNTADDKATEAMAASIIFAADKNWRPAHKQLRAPRFAHGFFEAANWSGVKLAHARLFQTQFSDADLSKATFFKANCCETQFDGANLQEARFVSAEVRSANFERALLERADLTEADARYANFHEANLSNAILRETILRDADLTFANLAKADLSNAQLRGARLTDAILKDAVLCNANLDSLDLRDVALAGANLESASLQGAMLEDIELRSAKLKGARLRGAYLTGSKLRNADLRGANLRMAYLAEVDWEGADLCNADLSGATFHMGSSRSGLVDSPIACEGSKTGFYTDDYEDRNFKRPEEIRKANLCGADLRGAKLLSVDLYLVDLRDAKLDSVQRIHAQKCGAILEDVIA